MIKTQKLMNKSIYLGLSILDLSNTLMYEFWRDYFKQKYGKNFVILLQTVSLPM